MIIAWMILALLPSVALAQARPSFEPSNLKNVLFAGYSSVNLKPGNNLDRLSLHGWTASITNYQFFSQWGLAAEFGGSGKDGTSQMTYLFGGAFRSLQRKRFALTGRILAGTTRWEPATPATAAFRTQTALTFGFGQGIDLKFSEHLALRVQPDIRFVRFKDPNGSTRTSFVRPFSVGLVYQFGQR